MSRWDVTPHRVTLRRWFPIFHKLKHRGVYRLNLRWGRFFLIASGLCCVLNSIPQSVDRRQEAYHYTTVDMLHHMHAYVIIGCACMQCIRDSECRWLEDDASSLTERPNSCLIKRPKSAVWICVRHREVDCILNLRCFWIPAYRILFQVLTQCTFDFVWLVIKS
jgi:hypothetical protein